MSIKSEFSDVLDDIAKRMREDKLILEYMVKKEGDWRVILMWDVYMEPDSKTEIRLPESAFKNSFEKDYEQVYKHILNAHKRSIRSRKLNGLPFPKEFKVTT